MSLVIMFRTLIHPSSGACDFSIESPHWSCVLVSMCVGVSVWLGWGGIRVAGLKHNCVELSEILNRLYQLRTAGNDNVLVRRYLPSRVAKHVQRILDWADNIATLITNATIRVYVAAWNVRHLLLSQTGLR